MRILFFLSIIFYLPLAKAYAYEARPSYKLQSLFQYSDEYNRDLGSSNEGNIGQFTEQLVFSAKNPIDKTRHIYSKIRAYNSDLINNGNQGISLNSNDEHKDEKFIQLNELYYSQKFSNKIIKIGRQRLREDRSLWWNSDQDLLKLSFKNRKNNGFIAIGDNLFSYRSDGYEDAEDVKRLRILGEYSYEYFLNNFLVPRFIVEYDHSGEQSQNDTFSRDDVDKEDIKGLYLGVRGVGKINKKIEYRSDIIGLLGNVDSQNFVRITNTDQFQAGPSRREKLRSFAIDTDVSYKVSDNFIAKLGYAYGSGDRDGGTNSEFRQSGLESGSRRSELNRYSGRNYGEVFRPELSNIHILTTGFSYNPIKSLTLGTSYFYYKQSERSDNLRQSGITANPSKKDKTLGQEIDVGAIYQLKDDNNDIFFEKASIKFTGGAFFPGAAYEEGSDISYRLFTELKFEF